MGVVLFIVIAANVGVFAGLAVWAARSARREPPGRLRTLTWAFAAVSLAFVLGAVTRAVAVAVRQGWLSGRVGDFLVGDWHLVQSLMATGIGIAGVVLVRRYAAQVRAADRIASKVSDHLLAGGSIEQFGLTNRELEVLEVIASGATSDSEIADQLFISPATAGTHVKNILRKTGTKSRRELVFLVDSSATS